MNTQQINALKRLQRAGDPESVTNQKLRAATQTLVDYIIEIVPRSDWLTQLPHGYAIIDPAPQTGPGPGPRLTWIDAQANSHPITAGAEITLIHRFAAAVAAGLIEEIEAQYQPSIAPGGVFL